MKAITLWQPYASLMAVGLKKVETRSRLTHHRGDLVICAAKRRVNPKTLSPELCNLLWLCRERFKEFGFAANITELCDNLPLGQAVCVVNVTEVMSTNDIRVDETERLCGDYRHGRFGWLTTNLRPIKTPIPVKGGQFFFNLPEAAEELVRRQL